MPPGLAPRSTSAARRRSNPRRRRRRQGARRRNCGGSDAELKSPSRKRSALGSTLRRVLPRAGRSRRPAIAAIVAWQCTFAVGVGSPTCAAEADTCLDEGPEPTSGLPVTPTAGGCCRPPAGWCGPGGRDRGFMLGGGIEPMTVFTFTSPGPGLAPRSGRSFARGPRSRCAASRPSAIPDLGQIGTPAVRAVPAPWVLLERAAGNAPQHGTDVIIRTDRDEEGRPWP